MLELFARIAAASKIAPVSNLRAEHNKINLLRIFLGLVILIRTLHVLTSSIYYSGEVSILSIVVAGVSLLFVLGLFTPIATFALFFLVNYFDFNLKMGTLGTSIITITLLLFLLLNAGSKYSLDAWLHNNFKKSLLAKFNRWLYSIFGFPDAIQMKIAFFLVFVLYGIMSFSALSLHLTDAYWTSGHTSRVLFVNSYLCAHYDLFRWIELNFTNAFSLFSKFSSIGQSLFQFLMIPLIFTRWGRGFVFLWGMMFFIISELFLQLSYLPATELILWLLIFYRGSPERKINILYDDYCNLCKKTITFLSSTDVFRIFTYTPISKSPEILAKYELSRVEVQENIHGVFEEKVFVGYDMYYLASKKNQVLWILFPFFFLGKITRIGYWIYSIVAKNRIKYFGTCEISFYPSDALVDEDAYIVQETKSRKVVYFVYLICSFVFLLTIPHVSYQLSKALGTKDEGYVRNYLYKLGFQTPDVFNKTDLSMGDHWYTLWRVSKEGKDSSLVPINGVDGERLSYHKSDLLYFGNSLKYRRGLLRVNFDDPDELHKMGFKFIAKVAFYDYRLCGRNDTVNYTYSTYKNSSSIVEAPLESKYSAVFKSTYSFKIYRDELLLDEVE